MDPLFNQVLNMIASGFRLMTPIALATMGITLSEAAGVIHLSAEGIMLASALGGVIGSFYTGSAWVGLLVAVTVGLAFGVFQGVANIKFKANQVIVGFGINFLGMGLTPILVQRIWGNRGRSSEVARLSTLHWDFLDRFPIIGQVINGQGVTFFAALLVLIILIIIFNHTAFGLRLRMVGEHPAAAATAGIRVNMMRYIAVIIGCGLCGLAGADLSLNQLALFTQNMTAGRGFVAVAANVVGGWSPMGGFLASMLFGMADALQLRLQGGVIPSQFAQMIPYLATVLVVSGVGGRIPPRKLGAPYDPEQG
jgi:general nucleoside transport system permease protein